ncbi:hypothetical protein ACIQ2D_13910 [Lysinibacillus sp. NPDC097287]|uniref:hypothetical protein n=1 Tax=Lysinibacillus sp. NPDC097287 TaxID=3364144 RepID=UPI003814CF22
MAKGFCIDFPDNLYLKHENVRLNDRKKEYIKKFQKAKVNGMILEIGKVCEKTTEEDF